MTTHSLSESSATPDVDVDVDVLVIGAGIIGIYQLYRAREAGFDVKLLEAGDGVGGVWYWNRYPQARFDSESYTYGYLFSQALFEDWKWSEHFAGQPEIERYINHVVDRFDLRQHIQFGARVTSAVFDDASGTWTVQASDGTTLRAHVVISVTGGLSAPVFPTVPGLDSFQGVSHHTGLWPTEPVDFTDQRVAVVGTGPSGVQIVPPIAAVASSLTVYQRTPNWCTPLNNRPITDEEQAALRANFAKNREILNASPSGFLHPITSRTTADVAREDRPEYYEQMWRSAGFSKQTGTFIDITSNKEANSDWCEFVADKIRTIVKDRETADRLIPKDHAYGGKRTPFEVGYFETFNRPNVELVDLTANPMLRVTETSIETTEKSRAFDIIVWATGFDFGVGSLLRMGVVGSGGLRLNDHWAHGPTDFLGIMAHGFPNFFFPGGPHGAGSGNYPRQASDQVDFITDTIVELRDSGKWLVEVPKEAEDKFMKMVAELAPRTGFSAAHSHYYGANIEGKARKFLLNPGGRAQLHSTMNAIRRSGWSGFLRDLAPRSRRTPMFEGQRGFTGSTRSATGTIPSDPRARA
jgi:cation diffusion facilitator CzcD-associated flavoprotein CzcO